MQQFFKSAAVKGLMVFAGLLPEVSSLYAQSTVTLNVNEASVTIDKNIYGHFLSIWATAFMVAFMLVIPTKQFPILRACEMM